MISRPVWGIWEQEVAGSNPAAPIGVTACRQADSRCLVANGTDAMSNVWTPVSGEAEGSELPARSLAEGRILTLSTRPEKGGGALVELSICDNIIQ